MINIKRRIETTGRNEKYLGLHYVVRRYSYGRDREIVEEKVRRLIHNNASAMFVVWEDTV